MENHTFSDPLPVKDAPTPTWTVDVIRLSGQVLVGTLTVNAETLPPRKNRKRIAWKLPDDPAVFPKFGEHERKRLWEMFKEQKKQRRRQSKKTVSSSDGEKSEGDEGSNKEDEPGEEPTIIAAATTTANTTPDHSVTEMNGGETAAAGGGPDDYDGTAALAPSKGAAENGGAPAKSAAPAPPPSPPEEESMIFTPPPPGFHVSKMTLDEPKEPLPPAAAAPAVSSAPPPGASAPPLRTSSNGMPPPPPGMAPAPPPAEPTLPPSLYFTLADDKPLQALGALVVPLFLQSVQSSPAAGGNVVPWLAHSHPTLSQTTLCLGSAQATGRTYLDRYQQWQSLTLPGSAWDCTGCTSQTLPTPLGTSSTVLLVLTGRTIQKQECLAYHLSLVLTATAATRNFQITNEILSLTALTNVPIPA